MPLLYFVCNHLIDVCIDINVMMSSDLYGTCSSADIIVMSCTNSNLPYGTQRRCNCNPFGNVATVTMQTSFTVSVISFITYIDGRIKNKTFRTLCCEFFATDTADKLSTVEGMLVQAIFFIVTVSI